MKRTLIAWALLPVMALGVTPALAASPLRDVIDWSQTVVESEQTTAGTETNETLDPAAGSEADGASGLVNSPFSPNQSIVSVSGGAYAAEDGASNAAQPGAGNTPPVAENQQIETYRGVSIGGRLSAYDADGDTLTYEICTDPMKGSVQLSSDGCFVYTPKEGKRGKDYFGFRAIDAAGNVSQEGTVIIKLIKQKSKVTYSDLEGNGCEYPAVVLTEAGVFTAENVGSDYVFNPDAQVTRGEFLSMCMTATDCDILKGVSSTGFQDDGQISPWLKPYVATALMNGYIQGQATETGAIFDPAQAITLQEACVTLNAALGVTNVVSAASYVGEDNGAAPWAQAVANLTACGVMLRDWTDMEAVLTRSGAAELLANAIGLIQSR